MFQNGACLFKGLHFLRPVYSRREQKLFIEFLLSKSANRGHLSVPRHVLLIKVPTKDIEKTSLAY